MSNILTHNFIKIYDFESKNLLEFAEMSDSYLEIAMTSSGNTDYRQCKNFWFDKNVVTNFGLPGFFKEFYSEIDNICNKMIDNYCLDFPLCEKSLCRIHTGFHLLKYDVGDNYKEHVDDFGTGAFRRLSISLCLNDEYSGGEFEFFNSLKLNLKKNQAIVFPSSWLFSHKINPITNGVRRSIVTWFI
jgi:hypothetical protein